jgi:hypothetical protein
VDLALEVHRALAVQFDAVASVSADHLATPGRCLERAQEGAKYRLVKSCGECPASVGMTPDRSSVLSKAMSGSSALLFVPSVFVWPRVVAVVDAHWQPTLVYPARGVGLLWEPETIQAPDAAAALLGRARAAVLASLGQLHSTVTSPLRSE